MAENWAGADSAEGWYNDPSNKEQERYWSGTAWTLQTRPAKFVFKHPPPQTGSSRSTTARATQGQGRARGCALWAVGTVGVGVVAVALWIANLGGGGDEQSPSDDSTVSAPDVGDIAGAQVACRGYVRDQLKSPSSAKFSDETVKHTGGKRWFVVGAVDSDNSFGASIRNGYTCRVKYLGPLDYELIDLDTTHN